MCGIAVLLRSSSIPALPTWPFWAGVERPCDNGARHTLLTQEDVFDQLSRRGPDAALQETLIIGSDDKIHFTQTVLSHRSTPACSLFDDSGNVLLYNGELYDGIPIGDNDDRAAFSNLLEQSCAGDRELDNAVLERLDKLRGPWTFIFWHAAGRRLYFARDVLGRRSLLVRVVQHRCLELVSVPPRHLCDGFVEVPTIGLGYLEFRDDNTAGFGLVPRTKHMVLPMRVAERQDEDVVSGSQKHMYVSFLPKQWLRSLGEVTEVTLKDPESSAQEFLRLFRQSIKRRLVTNRRFASGHSRYAVLFSGGIDSLVMAATLDECLRPDETIQLINVAFGESSHDIERCPDRETALSGLRELKRISRSHRNYVLSYVDIRPKVADAILEKRVTHLVHPCNQPMDATIGTAIWAAASANPLDKTDSSNSAVSNGNHNVYSINGGKLSRQARILFSGLGADELMGGYKGRHRTIFRTEGTEGIMREMDADMSRLWFRNLGRDDRLIADHGKEVRHPYLDEDLISFVTSLPLVSHVCDLSQPDGIGDKHLLRRAARLLGFSEAAASRSKRAIQFGSRSKQIIERKRR